jgi:double-stranded uracil-DNA glycosylase
MDAAYHRCFAPVVDRRTRLLVLGSLPGRASLAAGRYYAHPRNQFWALMSTVIDEDLTALDYDARLERLRAAGVGLWDTVAEATRPGSLDAAIRLRRASDLAGLVRSLPGLRAVAFNGATAARIGRRSLAGARDLDLIDLPSSSPAFTMNVEAKRKLWAPLRVYVGPGAVPPG